MAIASDIDDQIMAALQQIFAYELQQQVVGDSLALKTLKPDPLQDDPTLSAPYVIFKPFGGEGEGVRLLKHEEEHLYGGTEIGGPIRYLHLYECEYGTPQAATRQQARSDAAGLQARIVTALIKYMDLSGVLAPGELQSADQSQRIEGQNYHMVTHAGYRIYGGEQTFFGKGRVFWQYPVCWYIHARFFAG